MGCSQVEAEHHADIGINWDTLYCAIETLLERNLIFAEDSYSHS
jgi:hypothetical protein